MRRFSFHLYFSHRAQEKGFTFATSLTVARMILVPCIVSAMILGLWGSACVLFIIASLTDLFDGICARWLDQKTFLGACLDPLADKFLLVSCFATLAWVRGPLFVIPTWFVWYVLVRELVLIGGTFVLYVRKGSVKVCPTILGKATTCVQICFIVWLFACYFFRWLPIKTYWFMICLMLCMVTLSLCQYLYIGFCEWRER